MLNIKVNRKEFLKAIQIVENSVAENNKIREVLSGIYIEALKDKIILKGTDLELTINTEISGEVFSEGKIVIKHKLIEEFLKQILDDKIELTEEQGRLSIKTETVNTEFSIYNSENYPIQPKTEIEMKYIFNKSKFLSYIEKVKISASNDPEKLAVNCIRMEIEENKLKLVSSDTYRLMYIEDKLGDDQKNNEAINVSIPLKAIDSLIKIMKLIEEETVIFQSDGTKVLFRFSNTEILTRVIELQFPDYKSILKNTEHDKKILLNTKDFLALLKRAFIFVRENKEAKNGAVFTFENNKLILKGINENAQIKEELITIQEGEKIKISLNVKYLIDYISTIEGKVTELKLINSKSSIIAKDEENENSIYFTMPLSLKG